MLGKVFAFSLVFILLLPGLINSRSSSQGIKTLTVCASGCAFNKIQVALDAAASGDTIVVNTGVYREFLRIKKSLTLVADGLVMLRPSTESSLPQALVTLDNAKDVRLAGFTIVGSALAGIFVSGGLALIENNALSDNALGVLISNGATVTLRQNKISDGVSVRNRSTLTATQNMIREGAGDGIAFVNSNGIVHENEIAKFEANGVSVKSGSSVNLTQNTISASAISGIEVGDLSEAVIESNTISQSEFSGIAVISGRAKILSNQLNKNVWGVRVGGIAEIRDNRIQGSRLCALWADTSAQVAGNVNKLSENGAELCGPMLASLRQATTVQTNRAQVSVPDDYKTLQEAVDAVAIGGTVILGAGTLAGPVGIYKNMTIQGTTGTVLDGGKKIAIVIAAEAKKVSLQNLTVRNSLVGIRVETGSSETNVSLDQVTISSSELDGVQVRSTALVTLQKSTFNATAVNCQELVGCGAISVGRRGEIDGTATTTPMSLGSCKSV